MGERNKKGQFKPGRSGNPKGRPCSDSVAIRRKLGECHEGVIKTLIEAANGGDIQACKIVLDRICPPLKAQATPISVKLPLDANQLEISKALLGYMENGQISPDICAQLISALDKMSSIEKLQHEKLKDEDDEPIGRIEIEVIDPNNILKNK